MEITDLNLIGDFEAQMKCLQNPSLIPKLSSIDKLPHFYSLWTFGALILAAFATFTAVFNRIKTIMHKIRVKLLLSCRNSCPQQVFDDGDFDFDFSDDEDDDDNDDDDDDDTTSSVADSDDDEVESNDGRVDEVFRYWGNNNTEVGDGDGDGDGGGGVALRRRNGFRWSDFSAGKSVVKLWDGFGLGLDFDDDESEYGGESPIWGVEMSSGRRWEVAAVAEDGGLTAEMGGGVAPAVYAAWRPPRRRMWVDGDGVAGEKEE